MPKKQQIIFETAFNSYQSGLQFIQGGTGTVVKAEDESHQTYAVKYLSPESITSERVKRFKNELFFCEKYDHPNIVKVSDWGWIQLKGKKCPFYVMPFYESTLRQLLNNKIPSKQILPFFSQILDGVEAAHFLNVWHRDLKPENILVDPDREVLAVADFGIAHFAEPLLQTMIETNPRSRLANFQYAAPEQREREGKIDARADIYALGLILNEMFTEKLAIGSSFKRIAEVDEHYGYLDELVIRMLSQSPDQRPQSIAEIKRELIARENNFISQQKLNQLKNKVIPDTEIDDPLIIAPPTVIDAKWENDYLNITLSQVVNDKWRLCFQDSVRDYGNRSAYLGKGPREFKIRGNSARVCVGENENQINMAINYMKKYILFVNDRYKESIEKYFREKKANEEEELRKQIELDEKTRRINKNLKI